jgi:hypothetical protein
MSLRPQPPLPLVPDDTARIARAAFRRGNPYVLLRDRLGVVEFLDRVLEAEPLRDLAGLGAHHE